MKLNHIRGEKIKCKIVKNVYFKEILAHYAVIYCLDFFANILKSSLTVLLINVNKC